MYIKILCLLIAYSFFFFFLFFPRVSYLRVYIRIIYSIAALRFLENDIRHVSRFIFPLRFFYFIQNSRKYTTIISNIYIYITRICIIIYNDIVYNTYIETRRWNWAPFTIITGRTRFEMFIFFLVDFNRKKKKNAARDGSEKHVPFV